MSWWVLFLKTTYALFLSGSKFHLVKNCITNSTSNTVWLSIYHAHVYYSTYIAKALFCICLLWAVYKYIFKIYVEFGKQYNTVIQFLLSGNTTTALTSWTLTLNTPSKWVSRSISPGKDGTKECFLHKQIIALFFFIHIYEKWITSLFFWIQIALNDKKKIGRVSKIDPELTN